MIEIRQAAEEDIPTIEDILLDAFNWLDNTGKKMWTKERISWESLSAWLKVNEFYIAYIDGKPVGCMALTDYDPNIWENIQKGESLFIHRLAVKRIAAGQGVSKALIDYAKMQAIQRGINVSGLTAGKTERNCAQYMSVKDLYASGKRFYLGIIMRHYINGKKIYRYKNFI